MRKPVMEPRHVQEVWCTKRTILDTRTNQTHHIYECSCGGQSWISEATEKEPASASGA